MKIDPASLTDIVLLVLELAGARVDIAHEVATNLVEAEMCGHGSHGRANARPMPSACGTVSWTELRAPLAASRQAR